MLTVQTGARFRGDVDRVTARGKDLAKLEALVRQLAAQHPLEPRHRDHKLKGPWTGYRECHIEPDWLLLYKVAEPVLRLERTGTHQDIFGR